MTITRTINDKNVTRILVRIIPFDSGLVFWETLLRMSCWLLLSKDVIIHASCGMLAPNIQRELGASDILSLLFMVSSLCLHIAHIDTYPVRVQTENLRGCHTASAAALSSLQLTFHLKLELSSRQHGNAEARTSAIRFCCEPKCHCQRHYGHPENHRVHATRGEVEKGMHLHDEW